MAETAITTDVQNNVRYCRHNSNSMLLVGAINQLSIATLSRYYYNISERYEYISSPTAQFLVTVLNTTAATFKQT